MQSEILNQQSQMLAGFIKAFYVPYKDKKIGPYYVRCWKKNGKCHREYIKHQDLERVRAACERNRQRRQSQIRANKELTTVCGNLNYLLRMVKRSIKGTLRPEDHNHLAILETQGPTAPGRPSLRNKTLPLRVGEVPRSGDGGVHHTTTNSTSPLANSALRAPNSELEKHFIAPLASNCCAAEPGPNVAATPCRAGTPNAQGPTPKAPKWLTPNLVSTLLAKLPQSQPTYSQTSLQQQECFRPPKPRKVIKYMLGPRDAKEWKLVSKSEPDANGIVYEHYVSLDDHHNDPTPRLEQTASHIKPTERSTFQTTINGVLTEIEDEELEPFPTAEQLTEGPVQEDHPNDTGEIELAGPDYHARHRRPIDLTTGEEIYD